MILILMAEGEVMESIIIDKKDVTHINDHIKEYNRAFDDWVDNINIDDDEEFPSFTDWLDREKNITTASISVGVISIADGYWYT